MIKKYGTSMYAYIQICIHTNNTICEWFSHIAKIGK